MKSRTGPSTIKRFYQARVLSLAVLSTIICGAWSTNVDAQHDSKGSETTKDLEGEKWTSLFDGKTLGDWKSANFGGEGNVEVRDKQVVLSPGVMLTGITWTKEFPKSDYEVELEAQRVDGIDFFCGITFPVKESHCSFIVGGWAGSVVGLSSIDGRDASENDTTKYMDFEDGRWYRIKVRVEEQRIRCWIDDKIVVDEDIEGHKLSIRPEVDLSRPLGIASFQTTAALKNLRYRRLEK